MSRPWFPHLDFAGEPMREGQFREPYPMAEEGGRFAEYPTESLAAQCRMQARENLDPEYSQFMLAVADRLLRLS